MTYLSVDPKVYAEKYEGLADRYAKAKERLDAVNEEIGKRNCRKEQMEAFLHKLEQSKQLVTEFDVGLWNAVIESLTIFTKDRIVFRFKGGAEIDWRIE